VPVPLEYALSRIFEGRAYRGGDGLGPAVAEKPTGRHF
jgi:hypothetical protein